MISVTQMKSDSASTASGIGILAALRSIFSCKLIVDLRDCPRLSKGVDIALKHI